MTGWLLLLPVAALVGVLLRQYASVRGTHVPLSQRQPARQDARGVPLGMEATDLAGLARSARVNETLERSHTSWTGRWWGKDQGRGAATDVAPWPDDHTYAARFHAAFHKDRSKDH